MKRKPRGPVADFSDFLAAKTTTDWELLPDIGLYMDQVVTYLQRQLEGFRPMDGALLVTPSMINNYAKVKVIPRTEGKKYSREQIALLIAVFTLKRVLSVQDIKELLARANGGNEVEEFYAEFRESLATAASSAAAALKKEISSNRAQDSAVLRNAALKFAVDASMRSTAAEILLSMASDEGETP